METNYVVTNICPFCGGRNYQAKGSGFYCPDCKTSFLAETVQYVNTMQAMLSQTKQDSLATARKNLFKAVHKEYRSSLEINTWCIEIRKIIPNDFFSNFYLAVENGSAEIISFLKNNAVPSEYVKIISDYLLNSINDSKPVPRINFLIEKYLSKEEALRYKVAFEKLVDGLDDSIFNSTRPREIFLAYSDVDKEKVIDILEFLESEGYRCFSAFQNIRHGIVAKDKEIKTAIDYCKCLLFISSENSRSKGCDAIDLEIPYMYDNRPKMKRLEYLIEPYGNKTSPVQKDYLKREIFLGLPCAESKKDLIVKIRDLLQVTCKHDLQYLKTVAPTCIAGGYTEYRCSKCGEVSRDETTNPIPHKYGAWSILEQATCKKIGTKIRICDICKTKETQVIPKMEHSYSNWGVVTNSTDSLTGLKRRFCYYCKEAMDGIIPVGTVFKPEASDSKSVTSSSNEITEQKATERKEETIVTDAIGSPINPTPVLSMGTTIALGMYPQTLVKDKELKKKLNTLAGTLPSSNNSRAWTSYQYRSDQKNENDFMWYQDVTVFGEKYRGVYFIRFRPHYSSPYYENDLSMQAQNGFKPSTVYWFKYEPIQWRKIEQGRDFSVLLADMILDSQPFYHRDYKDQSMRNGKAVYANNYALSDIRAWLNKTFFQTAFTPDQQNSIQLATIDNDAKTTNPDANGTFWNNGNNSFVCEKTSDRVWLLSEQEVTISGYGFASDPKKKDKIRRKKPTAYAKCQGVYADRFGIWRLRSAAYDSSSGTMFVRCDGSTSTNAFVSGTLCGIVPAIKIYTK